MASKWTIDDQKEFERRGIEQAEIEQQLELLHSNTYVSIEAPALIGAGIIGLSTDEEDRLAAAFDQIKEKSLLKFVPASGAASRMFKHLWGNEAGKLTEEFFDRLQAFAFWEELKGHLKEGALERQHIIHLLKGEEFKYDRLPKGLIPFHKYEDHVRNAFQEQLAELDFYSWKEVVSQLHFTIHPDFKLDIELTVERMAQASQRNAITSFSSQSDQTDTVSVTRSGHIMRDDAGAIIFRPGGHGALLTNLAQQKADYVLLKNIDNVCIRDNQSLVGRWKRILVAKCDSLKGEIDEIVKQGAESNQDWNKISVWIKQIFQIDVKSDAQAILSFLDRPLRVVGMVKNTGEPGGGPFWLSKNGKKSLQIVEKAEVDLNDQDQADHLSRSTHFNPVDLVCAFRKADGSYYDLHQFADRERSFVSQKSQGGKPITVLEHPGLWNGAMAHWNTVFVEVPLETFNPVKTVNDLLRPAHQPLLIL